MGAFLQRRSVRICRLVFRWIRISFLLVIFLIVDAGGYLHWVGLPESLKRPVLRHLRELGYDVKFSSIRLGYGSSLIIENASFQRVSDLPEPKLSAARAELNMQILDLFHARVAVKSLEVAEARLQFPAAGQMSNSLSLDNVQLHCLFVSTNTVRLTNTTAAFRGVRINVNGELAHAEAVREWKFQRAGPPKTPWPILLGKITDIVDQIHFGVAPRIDLEFSADARDLNSIRAHVSAAVPDVSTPWGDSRKLRLEAAAARLFSTNEPIMRVEFNADEAATRWAHGSQISLTIAFVRDTNGDFAAGSQFSAGELDAAQGTNFVRASRTQWDGAATLNGTNFHALRGIGELRLARAETSRGSAERIAIRVTEDDSEPLPGVGADWGFWAKLAPYRVRCGLTATNVISPKARLDSVSLNGEWRAPVLQVGQFGARLYGGEMSGKANIDVSTRELTLEGRATFDERRVTELLTPAARHWISQFDWQTPPDVNARLRLTLPAWTNRHPDWPGEVRRSLQVAGAFTARNGAFRGAPADAASGTFGYTNRIWTVPDLRATRGDGRVELSYRGSDETHEYKFTFDSMVDPSAAKPLLPEDKRHWLDEAQFSTPPRIRGEVWGRWHSPELTGFTADVDATNFVAHGEHVDTFAVSLEYTNKFLRARRARLVKGPQYATSDLIEADLATKSVYVTNTLAALNGDLIRRVSAPHSPRFLDFIQFDQPPAVRLSGSFKIGDPLATDMRFAVMGQRFHFTNITADSISGGVLWRGRHVTLTNVQAALYNTGTLTGWTVFDYVPKHGTDFQCDFTAKDIDLPVAARGLTGRTNKLEGMLDGRLVIDRASSNDRRTWSGAGHAHVHNALLWDIKIFGIFSPVLNAISPGSGNSRAYEAQADFVITNGVVSTDDLTVRSTAFRLLYRGTVDMADKHIDARAEAELLRDTWVFGPVLSALLSPLSKLFEYKISGTLQAPVKDPVYIPQPLMLLLRPFHTLKTMNAASPDNEVPANPVTAPSKK